MNLLKSHILSVGTLFDEKFDTHYGWPKNHADIPYPEDIKSFLLSQARKQNEVILKMIENLKKEHNGGTYGHPEVDMNTGWNAALDAIAELIKEANRE